MSILRDPVWAGIILCLVLLYASADPRELPDGTVPAVSK